MFGITPESFDPIDVVCDSLPTYEAVGVVDRIMFPIPFQGLIAPKGIRIIDRAFPRLGLDMPHEFFGTDRLHDLGVDAVLPLQKPKNDTFARCRPASLALPSAPKVGLIQLDLAFEFPTFQLGQMVQGFPESLVDPGDHFDVDLQIPTETVSWLEQIEPLQDRNLPTQASETFAFATELAFHIAPAGMQNLKGPTENTLATAQKVGRTTKNRVSSSNHAPVLAHTGYETP